MAGLLYLLFLICISIFLPLQAIAGESSASTVISKIVVVVVIAAVITIISIPYFYNRSLKKRRSKNLRGFLLNDPKTRDMLISKAQVKQNHEENDLNPEEE